jgi:hypothetical protein
MPIMNRNHIENGNVEVIHWKNRVKDADNKILSMI